MARNAGIGAFLALSLCILVLFVAYLFFGPILRGILPAFSVPPLPTLPITIVAPTLPAIPITIVPPSIQIPPLGGAGTPEPQAAAPGALPQMSTKPSPVVQTFNGCPPDGDGGDRGTNRLKNRVDEGNYVPVAFDQVLKLAWPKGIERRDRDRWSTADKAAVAQWEGIPISIEGYLAMARQQDPESTNCHGAAPELRDWHIWLTSAPTTDRSQSIVVEATPRVRANHPGWQLTKLDAIAQSHQRVRISGWLMLDPEHPDQVGQTRGTIWEIHPIMKIEVEQQGKWVLLDNVR